MGRDSVEPLLEVASFQIQVSSSRAAPGEGTRAYNVAGCRLRAPTRRITSRVLSPQGGTRTRSPPNAQPSHVYPSLRVRVGARPSPNPPHPVWNLATGNSPLLPWLPSLLKTLSFPLCALGVLGGEPTSVFSNGDAATRRFLGRLTPNATAYDKRSRTPHGHRIPQQRQRRDRRPVKPPLRSRCYRCC